MSQYIHESIVSSESLNPNTLNHHSEPPLSWNNHCSESTNTAKDDDDDNNNKKNMLETEHLLPLPPPPPVVSRVTRPQTLSSSSLSKYNIKSLPPKLTVKLSIHEEASSYAQLGKQGGTSDVTIEGCIMAQVQCSDANRNAPFCLETVNEKHEREMIQIRFNPNFTTDSEDEFHPKKKNNNNFVYIPKPEIGFVPIASYYVSNTTVQYMPLLLERKISVHGTACRIAIQVRSKLTNKGDIVDFTIALAIPEYVIGTTVSIHRGDGVWDELKRTVKWKRSFLKRGESFMVSVQGQLLVDEDGINNSKEKLHFPVMLRCSSKYDQISNIDFRTVVAEGYPASITLHKSYSFFLLHRLP